MKLKLLIYEKNTLSKNLLKYLHENGRKLYNLHVHEYLNEKEANFFVRQKMVNEDIIFVILYLSSTKIKESKLYENHNLTFIAPYSTLSELRNIENMYFVMQTEAYVIKSFFLAQMRVPPMIKATAIVTDRPENSLNPLIIMERNTIFEKSNEERMEDYKFDMYYLNDIKTESDKLKNKHIIAYVGTNENEFLDYINNSTERIDNTHLMFVDDKNIDRAKISMFLSKGNNNLASYIHGGDSKFKNETLITIFRHSKLHRLIYGKGFESTTSDQDSLIALLQTDNLSTLKKFGHIYQFYGTDKSSMSVFKFIDSKVSEERIGDTYVSLENSDTEIIIMENKALLCSKNNILKELDLSSDLLNGLNGFNLDKKTYLLSQLTTNKINTKMIVQSIQRTILGQSNPLSVIQNNTKILENIDKLKAISNTSSFLSTNLRILFDFDTKSLSFKNLNDLFIENLQLEYNSVDLNNSKISKMVHKKESNITMMIEIAYLSKNLYLNTLVPITKNSSSKPSCCC